MPRFNSSAPGTKTGCQENHAQAAAPPRHPIPKSNFSRMIKNCLNSKLIATAASELIVIGLKLVDAEARLLRAAGLGLALVSAVVLMVCWIAHSKTEAATVTAPSPRSSATGNRRNRRSRVSRAN